MNRKIAAAVLALIVVGTRIVLILVPQGSDSFHLEAVYPEGDLGPVVLVLATINDCTLNVSFVDDPDLLYSIDVQLYEVSPANSAFELTVNDYRTQSGWVDVRFGGILNIKSLQVVLGSGVPYKIVVPTSSNVNATFTYGNNAVGSDAGLEYYATGSSVNLTFTQNMVFSDTGMEVRVGTGGRSKPDYVYLYTELAEGLNGRAVFREPLSLHSSIGWAFRSQFIDSVTYSTDTLNPQPLLELAIHAEYRIHAWLSG